MKIVTKAQGDRARDRRVGGESTVKQSWWRRCLLAVTGGGPRPPRVPTATPPAQDGGHPGLPPEDLPAYRLSAWG